MTRETEGRPRAPLEQTRAILVLPRRYPGRDVREAVRWQPLKIEMKREETGVSQASAMLDIVHMLLNTAWNLERFLEINLFNR